MNETVGMSRENMAERIIESINNTFDTFTTRKRFELHLA
jgi:hypothetical protein